MDKLIYTAASGLKSHMAAQAAIANNMANASTIGFRAEKVNFDSLMLKGPGFDSRQPASEEVMDFDRSAGAITTTGRNLDIAIPGDQWMAVQATDGTEAYTRRGDLNISATGVLETGDGFPVMGSGGPITVPPIQTPAPIKPATTPAPVAPKPAPVVTAPKPTPKIEDLPFAGDKAPPPLMPSPKSGGGPKPLPPRPDVNATAFRALRRTGGARHRSPRWT